MARDRRLIRWAGDGDGANDESLSTESLPRAIERRAKRAGKEFMFIGLKRRAGVGDASVRLYHDSGIPRDGEPTGC